MICKRCGKELKKINISDELKEKLSYLNNNYDSANEVLNPFILNSLNINKEKFYNIIVESMNKKAETLFLNKKINRENCLDGIEFIDGEYYTHDK